MTRIAPSGPLRVDASEPITHLRAWRQGIGLSVQAAADLVGCDRVALWRAERPGDAGRCGGDLALRIHTTTGIPMVDLISRETRKSWTVTYRSSTFALESSGSPSAASAEPEAHQE